MKKRPNKSDKKMTYGTIRGIDIEGEISKNIVSIYAESKGAEDNRQIEDERVANLQVSIVGIPNEDSEMKAIYDDITKGMKR